MVSRRELYGRVAELTRLAGSDWAVLDDAMGAMRGRQTALDWGPAAKLFETDDALGWIYQAINAPALQRAYRGTALDGRKFLAGEIPAVTQLFTPKWVVEFLLQNSLGRLWMQMHPDTQLSRKWRWIEPARRRGKQGRGKQSEGRDSSGSELPGRADQIRVCDPACGTMNFGLVGLEMLREMYREEIDRAGQSGWPRSSCTSARSIDAAIVENNLFGCDIDSLAIELALRSLEFKIGKKIPRHHLRVADSILGQDREGGFDVVATNPPYLSARNLEAAALGPLKREYPSAWRDYYACFIVRGLQMLRPGGRLGVLCMQSFMFTAAFEKLRRELAAQAAVGHLAHFGPGLFDIGNPGTLQTAAMVLQKAPADGDRAVFYRLVDDSDKEASLRKAIRQRRGRFEMSHAEIFAMPRGAWMYWLCPASRHTLTRFAKLGQISPPKQGLATTDNARFVRYWWEVEPPGFAADRRTWVPYAKGGGFARWLEPAIFRVNWENDGSAIKQAIVRRYPYLNGQWRWVAKNSQWYGKSGITYSYLTSGAFSARRLEAGTFFDVAGSALFPDDPLVMLGILNSSAAGRLLKAINPTVNFQVGDLAQLPIPEPGPRDAELRTMVLEAIDLARQVSAQHETSTNFSSPPAWGSDRLRQLGCQLSLAERRIDQIVCGNYNMEPSPHRPMDLTPDPRELAGQWVAFALGHWFGRWGSNPRGDIARLAPPDAVFLADLRKILADLAGVKAARQIESAVGGLERFLAGPMLVWHNRVYRQRPIFWGMGDGQSLFAVYSLKADHEVLGRCLAELGKKLPRGCKLAGPKADSDAGTAARLAPLLDYLHDPKLRLSITKWQLGRKARREKC